MNAPSDTPSPSSRPHRFPKTNRILKSRDFRRIYDQGSRFTSRYLVAFYLDVSGQDRPAGARIGFTVPRALGKAVIRNRIKRRMREAFRLHLDALPPQWDVVVN